VDYVQPTPQAGTPHAAVADGAAEETPTHIVADRADQDHETGVATFYGKPVRLWQGGSQVQAPVIELSRVEQRLIGRGDASTGWSAAQQASQVHTTLMPASGDPANSGSSGAASSPTPGSGRCAAPISQAAAGASTGSGKLAGSAQPPGATQIASGGLIYSGILRQADFTGGFRADTVDASIRASQATVFLQQTAKTYGTAAAREEAPSLAGGIQRVEAKGRVEIDKPGLRATGERLLYTAADRRYVLSGDSRNPPRAVDARGTTTGAALVFNSCDDSVEALSAAGQPVRTESRVRNDDKKEKDKR
jgi:lipopolysaccharide export system protein LptA